MTATQRQREELHNLLLPMKEGEVSPDDIRRIDDLVRNDADLLEMYVDYMRLLSDLRFGLANDRIHATLARVFDTDLSGGEASAISSEHGFADDDILDEVLEEPRYGFEAESDRLASPALPPSFFGDAMHGVIGFFSQEIPFSLLVATIITGLGLWAGSMIYVSQPQSIDHRKS